MKLRRAHPEDAAGMVRVKVALPMGEGQVGGFLLGADAEQYAGFIGRDIVYVLEADDGEVAGFSIVLRDASVRQSELWEKKDQVPMQGLPPAAFDAYRVAYFEQLAVLPGPRFRTYAKDLALLALAEAFREHQLMFTTVVLEPVRNTASLPFLRGAGFRRVGEIDEVYPEYGAIRSAVYLLTLPELQERLSAGLGDLVQKVLGDERAGLL